MRVPQYINLYSWCITVALRYTAACHILFVGATGSRYIHGKYKQNHSTSRALIPDQVRGLDTDTKILRKLLLPMLSKFRLEIFVLILQLLNKICSNTFRQLSLHAKVNHRTFQTRGRVRQRQLLSDINSILWFIKKI